MNAAHAHPNAHPLADMPTPKPTPYVPPLTCGDVRKGGCGGHGGLLAGPYLLDKREGRGRERPSKQGSRTTPTTPTTPTPSPGGTPCDGVRSAADTSDPSSASLPESDALSGHAKRDASAGQGPLSGHREVS